MLRGIKSPSDSGQLLKIPQESADTPSVTENLFRSIPGYPERTSRALSKAAGSVILSVFGEKALSFEVKAPGR
jgi:hypothetical protein